MAHSLVSHSFISLTAFFGLFPNFSLPDCIVRQKIGCVLNIFELFFFRAVILRELSLQRCQLTATGPMRNRGSSGVATLAVRDMLEDPTQTITKKEACTIVAQRMGLLPATVQRQFNRQRNICREEIRHSDSRSLLTLEEEIVLVGIIAALFEKDIPINKKCLCAIVNVLLKKKDGIERSETNLYNIVKGFLSHHAGIISERKSQALPKKRDSDTVLVCTRNWVEWMQKQVDHQGSHYFQTKTVLNADETRFTYSAKGELVFVRSGTGDVAQLDYRDKSVLSALPFLSAAGEVICVVYVAKQEATTIESDLATACWPEHDIIYPGKKISYPTAFSVTKTGFMTGKLFSAALSYFGKQWQVLYPGLQCYLFLDNLACHLTFEVASVAASWGIVLVYLPKNTSHFLQPCDDSIFAMAKKTHAGLLRKFKTGSMIRGQPILMKGINVTAAYMAMNVALKKEIIQSGFRNTGLWPFDAARILKRTSNHELEGKSTTKCLTAENARIQGLCKDSFGALMDATKVPPAPAKFKKIQKEVIFDSHQIIQTKVTLFYICVDHVIHSYRVGDIRMFCRKECIF